MQRMKIMHITQAIGGVETYIRHVIESIDRDSYEICVVTSEKRLLKYCREAGIKNHHLRMARGFNPVVDIFSLFGIIRLIRKEKPTLVHLHSSKAGFVGRIAAKVTRCRSLFTPHGGSYLSFTGFKRWMFFLLEIIGKRFTDKLLCISHTEANRFIHAVGIDRADIFVIPNAIPVEKKYPYAKISEFKGSFKIGTIGRITPQKNPLLFVDVAYDVIRTFEREDVHFYFLGAGFHDHLRPEFEARIREYGITDKLHILEKGDSSIACAFLRQIDCFLLTSLYEGLSYALLEAMLASVPCVVSKTDGNNDVINNAENGFSCLTRADYLSAIKKLISDRSMAARIGESGRQYVMENHNLSKNIRYLEKIYRNL